LLHPRLWLSLGLIGSVQAQGPAENQGFEQLMQALQTHRFLNFRLISEYDPYHTGHRLPVDTDNPQYLALSRDHRYVVYDAYDRQKGSWQPKQGSDLITLRAEPNYRGGTQARQRFRIQSFDNRRLVLLWQGRHGYVERVYWLEQAPDPQ